MALSVQNCKRGNFFALGVGRRRHQLRRCVGGDVPDKFRADVDVGEGVAAGGGGGVCEGAGADAGDGVDVEVEGALAFAVSSF